MKSKVKAALVMTVVLGALCAPSLFAQPVVLDQDGSDWVHWAANEKVFWVTGFIAALDVTMARVSEEVEYKRMTRDAAYNTVSDFLTSRTIGDLVSRIDAFYRQEGPVMMIPIWRVFQEVCL